VHGDLGVSIKTQRPVLNDIADFAPATIELATIGVLIAIAIRVPLGIVAAARRDSWIDHVARLVSLVGVSSPSFWLAYVVLAIHGGAVFNLLGQDPIRLRLKCSVGLSSAPRRCYIVYQPGLCS